MQRHGAIHGDGLDLGAVRPQAGRERLARILGSGNQHAGADERAAAALKQRVCQCLRDEFIGHEGWRETPHRECVRRDGPNGGYAGG